MPKVSIIIPAYNEERYIYLLLKKVESVNLEQLGFEKEIIVVDDGSTDQTLEIAQSFGDVICYAMPENKGKGAAVQQGIHKASGEWILIQDADLEYDPNDYIPMIEAIDGERKVAIYGSRFMGQIRDKGWFNFFPGKHQDQGIGPWLMNYILGILTFFLYGVYISDNLTAYKLYPADIIKGFILGTHGFEGDHELTAKLIKAGVRIKEVPIRYFPRTAAEGKKIRPVDGLIAIWTFLKYRFI